MRSAEVAVPEHVLVHDTAPSASRDTGQAGGMTHTPRGEVARAVLDQIAQAVRAGGDGTIDVQLSPEELGRVRLTLTMLDGDLFVSISTERTDTLDLMRRHIDHLARDFRDQGYASVQFSFGQGSHHGPQTGSGGNDTARHSEAATDVASGGPDTSRSPQVTPPLTRDDRLDLRL